MWWWRKIRQADISQALRDEFELFGESVIAGAVTMTYNEPDHPEGVVMVRTPDAFTFTYSRLHELVSTHRKEALAWLRERRDVAERKEQRGETVEIAILIFVTLGVFADFMVLRTEIQQAQAARDEQQMLKDLREHSAATASASAALRDATTQMNQAVHDQLALSYEISLNVNYDIYTQSIKITNEGRASVGLWGQRIADQPPTFQKQPYMLTPGVPHSIAAQRVWAVLAVPMAPGQQKPPAPFVMFLKNERGEEFVGHYNFVLIPGVFPPQPQTLMVAMSPKRWSKKAATE
jgi:hypothetical protein